MGWIKENKGAVRLSYGKYCNAIRLSGLKPMPYHLFSSKYEVSSIKLIIEEQMEESNGEG